MIRTKLDSEESMSPDIKPFNQMFLGHVAGVVLRPRGYRGESVVDKHVIFEIICEDDLHWFPAKSGSGVASSHWLEDYLSVLEAAKNWCKDNCEPDMYGERQYGWKFRS